MKKSSHFALLCVAALTLAGCGAESGGSASETTAADPTSSSAAPSAAPTDQPSEEPTASESAEAGPGYSNEDLTALVSSLTDASDQPLTVMPAEQLDQAIILARTLIESATITPETCSALATENLQAPEGSTYAAGVSQAADEMTQTTITVLAVEDPTVMSDQLNQSQNAIGECSSYEVEFEGEVISSDMQPLEVTTDGETSFGAVATQTLPTGDSQTLMTVSAVKGNLALSAVKIGAEVAPEAQAELEKLINDALAAAE